MLDLAARDAGVTVSEQQIEQEYEIQYGELRVRHILVGFKSDAEDKELDEATAGAKARAIADQLRAARAELRTFAASSSNRAVTRRK